jgi:hypothetical protein
MADAPFTRFANAVAQRENALRGNAANTLNMTGSLQDIAAQTGAPGAIQASEIPAVAGLASQQAYVNSASRSREATTKEKVRQMPSYISGYKSYLKWRYPTRYGGGSGNDYSTTPNLNDYYNIEPLGEPQGFGGVK